jgi:hypothetical protein
MDRTGAVPGVARARVSIHYTVPMRRFRYPFHAMAWLALVATVLLALAPVATRLVQAQAQAAAYQDMCRGGAWLQAAAHAGDDDAGPAADQRAAAAKAGDRQALQSDDCAYCALAARTLVALSQTAWRSASVGADAPPFPLAGDARVTMRWRALGARAPPA